KRLKVLRLGPASDLMVGEEVIAIGNPFGYTNSVSKGIISAVGREIEMPGGVTLSNLIQHTASINPGNSGGPLLNINGELIGINVALREGAQNIAFAINASTVRKMLKQNFPAMQMAGVNHGLECQDKVIAETGDRHRVEVAAAAPETGAELKRGDHIMTVGDRSVHNSFDLERALWDKKPGERVELRVLRGGQELSV